MWGTPLPPEATVIADWTSIDLCEQLDQDPAWRKWWTHADRPYLWLNPSLVLDLPARPRPVTVNEDEVRYAPLIDMRDLLATPPAQQPRWTRTVLGQALERVRSRRKLPAMPELPQPRPLRRDDLVADMLLGARVSPEWELLESLLPAQTARATVVAWSGHRPGDFTGFLDEYFGTGERAGDEQVVDGAAAGRPPIPPAQEAPSVELPPAAVAALAAFTAAASAAAAREVPDDRAQADRPPRARTASSLPRFRTVEVYPYSGRFARPWVEHEPDCDAFAKLARGICELYSRSLESSGLRHKVSTLRIFLNTGHSMPEPVTAERAGVLSPTWTRAPEGFESASVEVPTGFAGWDPHRQQQLVLDAIDRAARAVAEVRGLDPAPFAAARAAVEEEDYTYVWTGAWKSSPGRRWRARCLVRLAQDGFGRLVVQIAAGGQDTVLTTSSEMIAWTTHEGFARAAKTLTWVARDQIAVIPYVAVFGLHGGTYLAQMDQREGQPVLRELENPGLPE